MTDSTDERPIFVVGCDRSGTTLLRLMLTCHPAICIPPESTFLLKLKPRWAKRGFRSAVDVDHVCEELFSCDEKFLEWNVDRSELTSRLNQMLPFSFSQFVAAVYDAYLQAEDGTAIFWGDKNPSYVRHVGELTDLFPHGRFVHVVRDGRAVYNSFLSSNRKMPNPVFPEDPFVAAHYWMSALQATAPFRSESNFYELRYEDLVSDPETELASVCEFLCLDFDPKMIDFHHANASDQLVPQHRLAWHGATLRPVDASKIGAWRSEMNHRAAIRFELVAGSVMARYGYEPDWSVSRLRMTNMAYSLAKKALIGARGTKTCR